MIRRETRHESVTCNKRWRVRGSASMANMDPVKDCASYENYDDKSSTYNSLRKPVGIRRLMRYLAQEGDTHSKALLDAGCGTGNYTVPLARYFEHVHAVDANDGMLEQLRSRLSDSSNIHVSRGNVCSLESIADESVDCCISCQVIHHLPGAGDFAALKAACGEWYRVLRPGGRLVVNFTTHRQHVDGMWWAELVPDALNRWKANAPDKADLEASLALAGFKDIAFEALLTPTLSDSVRCSSFSSDKNSMEKEDFEFGLEEHVSLYGDSLYMNPSELCDRPEVFSRSDSTFSLVTPEELRAAVTRAKDMRADGSLNAWFDSREALRREIGMTTHAYAIKVK